MVLEIDALSFAYARSEKLFENFSLSMSKGEIVSIVGESGSGKSTLFDLVTKQLQPRGGSISVGTVSQIYQDPYTSFHQSYALQDQIADVASLEGIDFWCEKISFEKELLQRKPHELSGGQLQRASILRALLMKPDLLLADEPTSALDNLTQLEVMQLLISLLDNLAILLVTHDEDLARWCSDRVVRITDFKTRS